MTAGSTGIMHQGLRHILSSTPVLCDGAWGTELQAVGLGAGECPDSWNLFHPEHVKRLAARYVEAGSRIILTNTFRANRIALQSYGLADQTTIINRAGVILSRAATQNLATVFASMGPTGKLLMAGDVTEDEVRLAFTEQAETLASAGASGIVLETFSDVAELTIALSAARATGLPVVASMVYDSGKERDRTMMGTTPEEAARAIEQAGADVIGANCGTGIEAYIPVCTRLRRATALPVWIKPNAGLPEMTGDRIVYRQTPEEFARHALALRDAGASFIGGCCGTTPEFIRELHAVLADD
ncbi:MAG: homocysteine S-methyltransferase family protein [Ignavibacteria bacterium]|nr:homocysteine S-methyltransferase family protein [Ignavibacteria bacterium]